MEAVSGAVEAQGVGRLERTGRRLGRVLLGLVVSLAVVGLALLGFLAGLEVAYAGRALPGVRADGVSLAGLDRVQAQALLRQRLAPLASGTLTVRAGAVTQRLPVAALGRDYDLGSMLDAAFGYGRSGTPLERAGDALRAVVRGVDVAPDATVDPSAIAHYVAGLAVTADRAPIAASVGAPTVGGGPFKVVAAVPGARLDRTAFATALESLLVRPTPGDLAITAPMVTLAPSVTTAMAQAAADRATAMSGSPLILRGGGRTWTVPVATERTWIVFTAASDGTYEPTLDPNAVAKTLAAAAPALAKPAVNAAWTTSGGRATGVIPAVDGQQLDVPNSIAKVAAAMVAGPGSSQPVQLATTTVPPAVTTAMATAALPKVTMLGQWTTYYTPYIENYWGKNISIPTSQINGMVLAPGQWFDFWRRVVISTALGYGPGGAIVNGHSEFTGALGGGICSTSTTLFNAALRSGLLMGDRTNHYYYLSRYPVGLDATVYKAPGDTVNMTFQNNTAWPIQIKGINGPGTVTFQIFGVPDGRRVTISTPIVRNPSTATSSVQYTSSLPKGTTQVIEYPVNGFDAWVTVTVTAANGSVINSRLYYSHYALVNGLTLIGTG